MANLPKDIIVDILIQLPIKSLMRFKCVCHQWCSSISNPGFVKLHVNKEDRQTLLLVGSVNTLCSIDYESYVSNKGSVEAKKVGLPMPIKTKKFDIVGCCDGLLCLVINEEGIVLCNPSTREFRELPCPGLNPPGPFFYGFGYDSSIDDYKVIKGSGHEMEILALKTNTWRRIQNFDYYVKSNQSGQLVIGAIHWIASQDEFKIVGLDLVEEKLFEVPPPDHNNIRPVRRRLSVLGGCLCLARVTDDLKYYEIWLMKEYGVGDSWTKLISYPRFRSANLNPILVPHCIMNVGEILICRNDEKLFIYNLDERTFKDLEICNGPSSWWDSWSYKESLVSPNKNLISPNENLLSQNEGNVIEINHKLEERIEARNCGKKRRHS